MTLPSAPCTVMALVLMAITIQAHGDESTPTLFIAPLAEVRSGDGRYEALASALPDLITALLGDDEAVAVVERGHLRSVLAEHEIAQRGLHDPDQAIAVGRLLKVRWVATGSLVHEARNDDADGPRLHATLQLWHTEDGRIAGSVAAAGTLDEPVELATQLARRLAAAVDVELPAVDRAQLDDHPLSSLHFLRGLGYFHAGQYDEALMAFFTVTALDPHHDRAAFQRVQCYLALDEVEPATIELRTFIERYEASPLHTQAMKLLAEHESAEP